MKVKDFFINKTFVRNYDVIRFAYNVYRNWHYI